MLTLVPEFVSGSIEFVSVILVTANQWVAESVNYGSTMDRDTGFTLVELVKSWSCCYVVDPKRDRKKILNSLGNIGTTIKGEKMSNTSVSYKNGLLKDLKDLGEAAAYLNAALEDGSQEVFMLALRDVADARGISDLSKKSGLNRENMYRILSEKGNPQLGSLSVLLESMGLKLAVEVKKSKAA
jgi:probable addiction module antidote protein